MRAALFPLLLIAAAAGVAGCASTRGSTPLSALPEMQTDRPDFTDSASIVPPGHPQLEMGYTFSRDEGNGVSASSSYPEAMLRVALVPDRLEFRIQQNVDTTRFTEPTGATRQVTGAEDLYLSAKWRLRDKRGPRPEVGVIFQTTVPTGSAAFGVGRVAPGVDVVYAWDVVPDFLEIEASTQANLAVDAEDKAYAEFMQSVSVGYSLADRLEAFTEWFASLPLGSAAGVSPAHNADAGILLKLSPRLQWDVRAGYGQTMGVFVGSGLAVRY